MAQHTAGPLTVKVSDKWPFDIETFDADGNVVFRTRLPCHSTKDKSASDAIECVNFEPEKRGEYSAANKRAVADEVLRAAAPDLLDMVRNTIETLRAGAGDHKTLAEDLAHKYAVVTGQVI